MSCYNHQPLLGWVADGGMGVAEYPHQGLFWSQVTVRRIVELANTYPSQGKGPPWGYSY